MLYAHYDYIPIVYSHSRGPTGLPNALVLWRAPWPTEFHFLAKSVRNNSHHSSSQNLWFGKCLDKIQIYIILYIVRSQSLLESFGFTWQHCQQNVTQLGSRTQQSDKSSRWALEGKILCKTCVTRLILFEVMYNTNIAYTYCIMYVYV